MKIISLLILIVHFNFKCNAQTIHLDSLKLINCKLDSMARHIFNEADSLGIDILMVRKYDSINAFIRNSYCRVLKKRDSCAIQYELVINELYEIVYCHISNPAAIYRKDKGCDSKFDRIEKLLNENYSENHNYFSASKPTLDSFSNSAYTFFGMINGKYIFETFDENFLRKFHSGVLYDLLTSYLGLYNE